MQEWILPLKIGFWLKEELKRKKKKQREEKKNDWAKNSIFYQIKRRRTKFWEPNFRAKIVFLPLIKKIRILRRDKKKENTGFNFCARNCNLTVHNFGAKNGFSPRLNKIRRIDRKNWTGKKNRKNGAKISEYNCRSKRGIFYHIKRKMWLKFDNI